MDYTQILNTATHAAHEAGTLARASLGNPGYQQWKGQGDLLVGSVLPIQQRIIDIIHAEFPQHAILAEESEEQLPPETDPLWIVDPIDGSLNFHQGVPHYAISIAYREESVFRVGVVYDPSTNEMFCAVRDHFARLNDKRIFVQQIYEGEDAYNHAIVGTDLPSSWKDRAQSQNIATILCGQAVGLNMMGSPALGLCYVAAGRYHAYYHTMLQLWDVAAASVILAESGGILTDIRGGSWLHSSGGYIASNGVIHGWMARSALAVLDRQR